MRLDQQHVFLASQLPATSHCYFFTLRSLRAAELQVQRIWARVDSASESSDDFFQDILIEVHFYFVALRNIHRFLSKVVEDPAFQHVQPAFTRINNDWLLHYSKGREAFEHIDQRLPGQKQEHQLKATSDSNGTRKVHYDLSLRKRTFTHSNLTFDISKEAFDRLKAEVVSILSAVRSGRPQKRD